VQCSLSDKTPSQHDHYVSLLSAAGVFLFVSGILFTFGLSVSSSVSKCAV